MAKSLYFLALEPPDPLMLRQLQEEFRDRFGPGHALRTPPHLTLVPPFRTEHIPELHAAAAALIGSWPRIPVTLNGFGRFSHARSCVIFAAVEPSEMLAGLAARLQALVAERCPDTPSRPPAPFHPHITLAHRDLDPGTFRLAWPAYRDRPCAGAFVAEAVTLFAHQGTAWRLGDRFPLGEALREKKA